MQFIKKSIAAFHAQVANNCIVAMPFIFLALVLAAAADYYIYPLVVKPDPIVFNHGENGLWMSSRWYLGKASGDEQRMMVDRLVSEQVRYAYFHVRDINSRGMLRYHCRDSACQLVHLLKQRYPGLKPVAWVGAVNVNSGGQVNLADAAVRKQMVLEARWLTQECGFAGIQWDFEVCKDGDANFLKLLAETRQALAPGKIVSIAAPVLWSSRYYAPLALLCDQIAVMCYDTVSYFPRTYVSLVCEETYRVTAAVGRSNKACRVILGVPTYKDVTRAHQKHAENLLMALVGVKAGLSDARAYPAVFAGVAPYADFTTDAGEWNTYRKYWLNDHGVAAGNRQPAADLIVNVDWGNNEH